ncbi:MAG: fucose permease [Candidatus Omnitrophota bacterium]|jgi:fucose permease
MRYKGLYFVMAFLQGICLPLISASSFIFHSEPYQLSHSQYGLVFLFMVFASLSIALCFRAISRFCGRPLCFLMGWAGHLVFLALLAWSSRFENNSDALFYLLLIANIFFGGGFSLLLTVISAELVDRFPLKREVNLTLLHGILGLGAALSPTLVAYFFNIKLWPSVFLFWCGVMFVVGIATIVTKTLPCLVEEPVSNGLPKVRVNILAYGFGLALIVYGTAEAMAANWTILFITQAKQLDFGFASLCLTLFWASVTAGRLCLPLLIKIIPVKILYLNSPWIMAVGLFGLCNSSNTLSIAASIAITGLGCSYFYPLSVSFATQYFDQHREFMISLTLAGLMIGVGIGSSGIGWLRDANYLDLDKVFYVAAWSAAALGLIAFTLIHCITKVKGKMA